MSRIIGVDLKGNIRYRQSKKNPVIIRSGTFYYGNEPSFIDKIKMIELEPEGKCLPLGITLRPCKKGNLVKFRIGTV